MLCHAVDGTKTAAASSRRTVEHREDLEKLLARVEAGLAVTEGAVEAAENAESDNAQLVPMLEETKTNLGKVAEETVADGGYASAQQLEKAQTLGYEVLVAPGVETGGEKQGEYHSDKFEYDRATDAVICPQGQRLKLEGEVKKSGQRPMVRRYHCTHYELCPVRALCSGSRTGRRIEISPQHAAIMRQREKRRILSSKRCCANARRSSSRSSPPLNKPWASGAGRCGDWRMCARSGRCCARPST